MQVLVTGGAGFIGAHLVHRWTREHPDDGIVVLDALGYAADPDALAGLAQVVLVEGDVADAALVADVLRDHRVDLVVNLAAESHNSLAVLEPARFVHTNVVGTLGVLEAARLVGVRRVHHVSTCEVYGDLALDDADGRFAPDSPYRPNTPYSASKAGGDHLVRAYRQTFGLDVTISVGANTYGPRQFPEKVVPLFVARALRGEPLPVYASAEHRREWVHVDDHVAAIEAVARRGAAGRTYHVGTGDERSVREVAEAVLAATGRPASLVQTVPDRPGHDRRYLLDARATRDELGWAPQVTFADGLASTVAWYRDHEAWWAPRLERAPVDETDRA